MADLKAFIREFIAGRLLGLALAVDASFVFSVIDEVAALNSEKAPRPEPRGLV